MGDKNVLMRPEDMEAFDIQCDMTGWESEEFDPRRMRTDQAVTTATVGRTEREVEDLGQERMCRVYRLREVAQCLSQSSKFQVLVLDVSLQTKWQGVVSFVTGRDWIFFMSIKNCCTSCSFLETVLLLFITS